MLESIGKDAWGEMSDAHIAKCLEKDADPNGLPKRLLASISLIVPIAIFVMCETETAMTERK